MSGQRAGDTLEVLPKAAPAMARGGCIQVTLVAPEIASAREDSAGPQQVTRMSGGDMAHRITEGSSRTRTSVPRSGPKSVTAPPLPAEPRNTLRGSSSPSAAGSQ